MCLAQTQLLIVLLNDKETWYFLNPGSRGSSLSASDRDIMKIYCSASVAVYLKGVGSADMSSHKSSLMWCNKSPL